jgi:hypothetical protein
MHTNVALMGEKTALTLNSREKASLRTTVPMFIVKQWSLHKGHSLDWSLELHDGELVAIVKRGECLDKKRSRKK